MDKEALWNRIVVGNCYSIAGRSPVAVVSMQYGSGGRIRIGYVTPSTLVRCLETGTQYKDSELRYRRHNSNSMCKKVTTNRVANAIRLCYPSYTSSEIDEILQRDRVAG